MSVRVMLHMLNDQDSVILVRHYDGSGVYVNLTEVYVIRKEKFLGRIVKDAWEPEKHDKPATEKDIQTFLGHSKAMQTMAEKLWRKSSDKGQDAEES